MSGDSIPKEKRQKIESVVHYILKDPGHDVSLKKLASVANYSPFHFQRSFTEQMGVSPKQFIKKFRLETACHFLIIQPGRSILEISMDTGFSSPSVFSRAFKNYFGISADQMRAMPQNERSTYLYNKGIFLKHPPLAHEAEKQDEELTIQVKRLPAYSGICINTSDDPAEIQKALTDIIKLAATHDLLLPATQIMGIIIPHHNIYRAFIPVAAAVVIPDGLNKFSIKAGKYATFKVGGPLKDIMGKISTYFFKTWLPENGYRIADIFGYELFSESPATRHYQDIEREICIPIEPL